MRTTSLIALFLFSAFISIAQIDYTVTVFDTKNRAYPDVKVWVKDKTTGKEIIKRTDASGKVSFHLAEGIWSINLVGLPDDKIIPVKKGRSGSGSAFLTYDKEQILSEQAIIKQRSKITLKEISQEKLKKPKLKPEHALLNVIIKHPDGSKLNKINVSAISIKHASIFHAKTGKDGKATFLVPVGDTYCVDVDGIRNYAFTREIMREGFINLRLEYAPTNIKENLEDGNIVQYLRSDTKATNTRSHLEFKIKRANGEAASNEFVYLKGLTNSKIYRALTDDKGYCQFLLPNGEMYMLSFDFQPDVDVYDLTRVRGRKHSEAKITYRPIPALANPESFIPTPEEVFVTEFTNFITKQLPEPTDKPIEIHWKWGNKVNKDSKESILELRFAVAGSDKMKAFAPKTNVAFVVDRSGSMAGDDRIGALKESMYKFVDELRPDDKVSLVSFNGEAFLDIPLQQRNNGDRLKELIGELQAGGMTNIYKGMVKGYDEILKNYDAKRTNHLVLLTDGYGETEPKIVIDKSKEYNQKGISISTIGVGYGYNYALLKLLSATNSGLVEHAGSSDDIYPSFRRQLSAALFPTVSKAKVEILYNKRVILNNLYGYPYQNDKKQKASFEIGNLSAESNNMTLIQFLLNKPDESIEKEPIIIQLSYFDYEKQKVIIVKEKAHLTWEPYSGKIELIKEAEQKKLYAIAIMNQSIKVMAEAFAAKDIDLAKSTLVRVQSQIKELFPKAEDKDIITLSAEVAKYANALENYSKKQNIEEMKKVPSKR